MQVRESSADGGHMSWNLKDKLRLEKPRWWELAYMDGLDGGDV